MMNELLTREGAAQGSLAEQAEAPSPAEPLYASRNQALGHGGFRLHFPVGFDFDF